MEQSDRDRLQEALDRRSHLSWRVAHLVIEHRTQPGPELVKAWQKAQADAEDAIHHALHS